MARLESVALGGYYPTPPHLMQPIANLIDVRGFGTDSDGDAFIGAQAWVDPCAGKGEAVLDLATITFGTEELRTREFTFYAIELEASRFKEMTEESRKKLPYAATGSSLVNGDAFRVAFKRDSSKKGATLLWLNPPYDYDRKFGRLEERFLDRFAPCLVDSGLLVFIVPHYALKASAETLGREFKNVHCFRFPEADFETYKQVVLFAEKSPALFEADPSIRDLVLGWAADAESIPLLPLYSGTKLYSLPTLPRYNAGFSEWTATDIDMTAVLKTVQPWSQSDRNGKLQEIPGILPDLPITDLLDRRYPVAMPPRPAHIAAGIAAGVFNGARIEADDPTSKLPPLLVKGVFDKEYHTVEEKKNKDGDVTGLVQVQQPKLVTTVLDLTTSRYHTIRPSADVTGSTNVEALTTADLLQHYGKALMRVMLQQCPVMHNPSNEEHHIALPELARTLFTAQSHATQASVKLLGGLTASKAQRYGKAVFVLGEIGSGKSSVALATMQAIKAKRTLIMCPPHLLSSWKDQIQAVTPWARTVVLTNIADVQEFAADTSEGPAIAILSRETAKLGHSWTGADGRCSKCGALTPDEDLAKKRSRCEHRSLHAENGAAKISMDLALGLYAAFPNDVRVSQLCRNRMIRRAISRIKEDGDNLAVWKKFTATGLDAIVDRVAALIFGEQGLEEALIPMLMADPNGDRIERVARALYDYSKEDPAGYGRGSQVRRIARELLLLLPPGGERQTKLAEELKEVVVDRSSYSSSDTWGGWERAVKVLQGQGAQQQVSLGYGEYYQYSIDKDTLVRRDGNASDRLGDPKLILKALGKLTEKGLYVRGPECGEPLYQAVPEPRRYPLATYISKYYPRLFDVLVLDEGHEYSTDGSAQERSAHRLTSLGIPTMILTGSIMNGYAESLFANMWALSPAFRSEFARDDRPKFVDRYGYRKRLIQDRDTQSGDVVAYGSMTDRIEKSERVIGNAPGVLPLFLLKHLLPLAVTIHKADLAIDIPPCTETVEMISPSAELLQRYKALETALVTRIKKDRFTEDLSGKLWGQVAELPSYLDRATIDTGNTDKGAYEIRYPESCGNGLVAAAEPFGADDIQPKEQWMLDKLAVELAEGRNVMVFGWHTILLPRLARLIEARFGIKVPILRPEKVPTAKRQDWIDKEIVSKKRRVLVVNPVAIQTGLNNLVYFSTEIWMENPACNPIIKRQAEGRVDRIGQTKETRIFFPVYAGTAQQALHELLMRKVAVSLSTDGLDAQSALQAAGAGDESGFAGFSVGKQLYELITGGLD